MKYLDNQTHSESMKYPISPDCLKVHIVSNFLRKINVDISNVIETTSYYPLSSLNICELLCLIKRFEAA